MSARVAAIVPARDEAPRIAATVRALRSITAIDEVIVVDDASTDATASIARDEGVAVVRIATRAGKGGALSAGLRATDAPIVCFIDGDLADTAAIAARLIPAVVEGTADMTIAAPPPAAPSGFGLVEGLARAGIWALSGARMRRPLSGQRALRREIVDRCGLASGFGIEAALTIDAVRAGYRVVEVPLDLEHRRTGRDAAGFAHRAHQGADLLAVLAARALGRRRPRLHRRGAARG